MRAVILTICLLFASTVNPVASWETFERNVRDGLISKDSARAAFPAIYAELMAFSKQFTYNSKGAWCLPIENGSFTDIGKGGFKPGIRYGGSTILGYNFYDGNRHGGHPAYDIFIRDKNQDCLDDRTLKEVHIIAPVNMTVISVNDNWKSGSEIRGGNYVWAMAPDSNLLLYFAHLDKVFVKPGVHLRQGEALGTAGRSGKNAWNGG
ncbi:MAG: M23 family metallopeptidase, partial [Chlorobiales bacterium]|nr:M23 family metallopeptidase [Chlorobiales bacterium]